MATTEVRQPKQRLLKTQDNERHNVCAYCRVSTDDTDQKNSLASQERFFASLFKKHPNWSNVGIFADEGLSGTSLEKRNAFNEMLSIARYGGIDIIITKEVSRFSRNVQDLLNIVEELRNRGIYVWFLSDDINTESNDYREKLSQIATNAEQESLRTSRRVKWGQLQQMERGVVFGRKEMYGYNIVTDEFGDQHFEIIPEEAEIIKQIYQWFASGDGTFRIAKRLQDKGIKTKRYKNGFSTTVILRILRNEKYVGDLAQGKTYTPNALDHKKKYNRGESAMVYIKDHHPESAIIDRELWDKVQLILQEKAPSEEVKAKHSNRYWTSGKVFCGCCGGRYVSYTKKQVNTPYKSWVCFENHQRGQEKQITTDTGETITVGCNGLRVNDRVLQSAIHDIITEIILPRKQEIIDGLREEFKNLAKPKDNSKEIAAVEKALAQLKKEVADFTKRHVKGKIPEEAYLATAQEYSDEISELKAKLAQLQKESNTASEEMRFTEYIAQIESMVNLTKDQINEGLYERVTKKIVVHPDKVLEIHLSFMPRPIFLHYQTSGRGEAYKATFTIIER